MLFLLTMMAHLVGDFFCQTRDMATHKRTEPLILAKHCLIYTGLIALALAWFRPLGRVLAAILIISSSHALIDYLKGSLLERVSSRHKDKTLEFIIFIADQVLHLLIIALAVRLPLGLNRVGEAASGVLLQYFSPGELFSFGVILAIYLICAAPSGIFISRIFVLFSLDEEDQGSDLLANGYLIGILERFTILTLWLMGQIGAIGFVIAAKSLARFKQLDNRSFAEKYLVGTLLSVLVALFCIAGGTLLLDMVKF
jgi:hypothetical protein